MERLETIRNLFLTGTRSLRTEGTVWTSKRVLQYLYRRTVVRLHEWNFDRKWNVETAGAAHPRSGNSHPSYLAAEGYEATPPMIFREIMNALNCSMEGFAFFDMGCGKGRALLMAAQYPFRRIVGVEFLPDLATIARNNAKVFRENHACALEIEVQCLDAARYKFPDEDAVIFFFNPFKQEVMNKVLCNIRRSMHSKKTRYIIYYHPVLENLFSDPLQFSPVIKTKRYHIYRMLP